MDDIVPLHQWTHASCCDGKKVLLVKCVERGGRSYNDFQWPKSGTVDPGPCTKEATCESGGLFGWPWGVNLGGGKDPYYHGDWIVFAAPPELVVSLNDKSKVAGPADVVYYGDALGALMYTMDGRIAWIQHNSRGSASATGTRGSASATGWSGSASATGEMGSASATGTRGSASATCWSGSASATGEMGSASATGWRGSASATGWSGSASATSEMGSASATGHKGIAALSGECGTIEVGSSALGAVTARTWYWRARPGALVAWRLPDGQCGILSADALGLADGEVVTIVDGQMTERHKN